MSETEFSADNALSISILAGKVSEQRELGLPFQQDVIHGMEDLGIVNEDTGTVERTYPDLPPFPPQVGPTNTIGLDALLIGVGIYVAKKLADKTVDGVATKIYERIVQPAFDRLWQKVRKDKGSPPIIAQFDHWFDGSKVLVRVLVHCDPDGEAPDATVVPAALRNAVAWLRDNPPTHRTLTFSIENGKVPSKPDLSDPF
jgi:hypothetical protein